MPLLQERLTEHLGGQAPSRLKLLGFKPVRKGNLRGFAEIRLPNGLIINDVVIGESGGRQWALLPSKAMLDRDRNSMRDPAGKPRSAPVVEWASKALRDEFSRRVIALIKNEYPTVFDGGG